MKKGVRSVCAPFQGSKILDGKSIQATGIQECRNCLFCVPFQGQGFLVVRVLTYLCSIPGLKVFGGKSVCVLKPTQNHNAELTRRKFRTF